MKFAPGELYLIDLGMIGKVRPAVIVSREDANNGVRAVVICAPLTTQNRGSVYEVPLGKLKVLSKESCVNVQGLTSLGHEKLIRPLGRLTSPQFEAVKKALRFILDL
ncbi:MAG: growth inhibitor [Verrucomicrobiales bacterium]|jgi:mRNA interferase MazF|nr:growth inhibitor [Verrucomicrobiales bacterium]